MATSTNSSGAARCPSCGAHGATHFHSVARTPVTCASIFDTAEEARAVPSGRVDLFLCGDCGLIFNPNFDAALAEVGARYEGSQAASAHFSQFARTLASSWIERHRLRGKPVLEIGCGNGEFLARTASERPERDYVGVDLRWACIKRTLRNLAFANPTTRRTSSIDTRRLW